MGLPWFSKKIESKNINFLPEEETAALFVKKDIITALAIPITALALLGLVFAGLFILETSQKAKNNDLTKKISQARSEWQKLSDTAATVGQINTNLKTYQAAAKKNKIFHDNLVSLSKDLPVSLVLSKIDLNSNGEATLDGTAPNPGDIYQFIEVLNKKSDLYSGVSLKNISYSAADQTYKFSVSFVMVGK